MTYLYSTTDALVWAQEFVKCKEKNGWSLDDIDEGLMTGWFANAMLAQELKCSGEGIPVTWRDIPKLRLSLNPRRYESREETRYRRVYLSYDRRRPLRWRLVWTLKDAPPHWIGLPLVIVREKGK